MTAPPLPPPPPPPGSPSWGRLDAKNQPVDLLVNLIGAYKGTTAYGLQGDTPIRLKISADGPWNVTIAPISTAPALHASNAGSGDAVYLWTGGAADWSITHSGKANFVVTEYGEGLFGVNLMVNEIGDYK